VTSVLNLDWLRLGRRLLLAAALFGLWVLIAWAAAKLLIVNTALAPADVIVVLSGSAVYRERTQRAVEYYRQGLGDHILLTNDNMKGGWSSSQQRNPFFYEHARDNLSLLGVPADRIEVLPRMVSSTYDEAVALREYAVANKLRSLLVVTSAYHSRRVSWTFGKVFRQTGIRINVQCVETGEQTPPPLTWWLYLRGWQMVVGEYVKNVYYRLAW
jgi:uncharacterized SAM-binding protein YcdF (DUF218 family)